MKVDTEQEKRKKRLKCSCCRREYVLWQFNKTNRKGCFVGRRCLACIKAGEAYYRQIMEEDEYKQMQAEREEDQARHMEEREELQKERAKSAAERAATSAASWARRWSASSTGSGGRSSRSCCPSKWPPG